MKSQELDYKEENDNFDINAFQYFKIRFLFVSTFLSSKTIYHV